MHDHRQTIRLRHSAQNAFLEPVLLSTSDTPSDKRLFAKLWTALQGKASNPTSTPIRIGMPVKDSDDYITARAANPRTGMISPSVAATPHTPESPADALRIRRIRPSPTRKAQQPALNTCLTTSYANEGRKIESTKVPVKGDIASWRKFLLSNDTQTVPGAKACQPHQMQSHHTQSDDRFIVKMPTAREPQPYVHPGSSSPQIQAFEHYKHKARRTSGEGYDRRLFSPPEQASRGASNGSVVRTEITGDRVSDEVVHNLPSKVNSIARKPVSKLDAPVDIPEAQMPGLRTVPTQQPIDIELALAKERRPHIESRMDHLNQLPRVKLVHPSLAALPTKPTVGAQQKRSCSLGCEGACTRKAALADEVRHDIDILNAGVSDIADPVETVDHLHIIAQMFELWVTFAMLIWHSLPETYVVERIMAMLKQCSTKSLTVWEVCLAVKKGFSIVVWLVAVLIVLSGIWAMLEVVMRFLQAVFWPLSVMLRFMYKH